MAEELHLRHPLMRITHGRGGRPAGATVPCLRHALMTRIPSLHHWCSEGPRGMGAPHPSTPYHPDRVRGYTARCTPNPHPTEWQRFAQGRSEIGHCQVQTVTSGATWGGYSAPA